jgi:hypothetical protein
LKDGDKKMAAVGLLWTFNFGDEGCAGPDLMLYVLQPGWSLQWASNRASGDEKQ